MELFVITILLTVANAQRSQFEGPENTLSVVGSNLTLKCLSPSSNCSGIEWMKYSPGNSITVFNQRGIISSTYRERYSVDNKSSCDLIIENVELTDAGRFLCRALISSNTVEKSAHLIILKTQPKCTIITPWNETAEGDAVQLTCEVTYNGTNRTSMFWKGVEDAPAAVENRKTISRSYSVVASAPEVPSFTCATLLAVETFDNGIQIGGLATNSIPVTTCSTPAIKVLYSVRDILLSPSLSNYSPGSVISCTAKGRPLPTFKWQEMNKYGTWMDIQNQNGSQFSVSYASCRQYRCCAVNVIKGRTYSATSSEFQIDYIGAEGKQLEGPENTLSIVGSNATLKCSSPSRNCNGIDWLKSIPENNPITVFSNRQEIYSAFRARYSVEKSSGCDLVIQNVEVTDAGRFICRAFISSSTVEKAAYLTVSEIQPKCTVNASLNNTLEGDGVRLTCEVTHDGTLNVPIRWKGVEDAPAAEENGNTISRSYYAVASAPEVPSFTCIASFAVEAKNYSGTLSTCLPTNIPNATCETPVIEVLYSVRNVTLSPSHSYYSSGCVITCTAKGRPLPTLIWQEMENDSAWMDIENQNGSEFSVNYVSSKQYRCLAINVVRGNICNATSHEFLVNNTRSDYKDKSTATANISVAVSAAVGFLLLIGLLIICFCVRVCPGYKCYHSDKIREEQPLRENPDIYSNANQVGEQESDYAGLGADREANEYQAVGETRQKAKPEKQSRL